MNTSIQDAKSRVDCRWLFQQEFPDHYRQQGNSFSPWGDGKTPSLALYSDHVYSFSDHKRRDHIDILELSRGVKTGETVDILCELAGPESDVSNKGGGNRAARRREERVAPAPPQAEKPRKSFASFDEACDHYKPIETYRYEHADGTLNYCELKVKTEQGKICLPLHEESDGRWYLDLQGVTRTLFGLPELLAADPSEPVFFCEGPKDTQTAQRCGYVAVTTGSSGSLKRAHADGALEPLRGRAVILWPDHDDAGRKMAETAREILPGVVRELRICWVPNNEEIRGFDLSDYVSIHGEDHAPKLIQELVETTPKYKTQTPNPQAAESIENCTDMGNARRMLAQFGDRIRHCQQFGWMIYDDTRWVPDEWSRIQGFAKDVVREIYKEAAHSFDEDKRKRLARWALSCETAHRIQAMIQLLPSEPGISVTHERFDSDKMLLNVTNGTLDLRTGELRPHDKDDLLTKLSPVRFDPSAECPRWVRFINEIMDGDAGLVAFIQHLLGYGITGETREQVWCFFWGKGRNGKSTLMEALAWILGDYAMNTPAETFLENNSGSIRNDLARLRGARVVTASEPRTKRFDHATIKAFTGEDRITARFMRKEFFDFKPDSLLIFSANQRPDVRDTSDGFWRRLLLVPFIRQFKGEERDPNLRGTLQGESSGILNWLIKGCLEWQQSGLNPPAKVLEAVNDYRSESDILGEFIENCCVVADGTQIPRQSLFDAYQRFCEDRNIRKPLSQKVFNENILTREGVFHRRIGAGKVHTWIGIGLRAPESALPPYCGSVKQRTCNQCDFEHRCPVENSTRDAAQCHSFKRCW